MVSIHRSCRQRQFCLLLCLISECGAFEVQPAGPSPIVDGGRGEQISGRRNLIKGVLSLSPLIACLPPPVWALSPDEASSAYDNFADTYDDLDGGAASSLLGLDEARSKLLSSATGSVLEIGVGTGLNLSKYDPSKVKSLTVVDISEGMLKQAKSRWNSLGSNLDIKFVRGDATSELASLFGENSFDTVVDSFSLCVMGTDGAKKCLDQMRRVAKTKSDGGRILLLENSRSSSPLLGWYQDVTAEAAASAGGKGCVYNQDVAALIKANYLSIEKETEYAAGLFRSYECTTTT